MSRPQRFALPTVPREAPPAEPVFIGLGANLGQRAEHLRAALAAMDALPGTRVQRVSPLYASAPVDADGPDYLNAVAELGTALAPEALLAAFQSIHQAPRGPPLGAEGVAGGVAADRAGRSPPAPLPPCPAPAGSGLSVVWRPGDRHAGPGRAPPAHGRARLCAAPPGRSGAAAHRPGRPASRGRAGDCARARPGLGGRQLFDRAIENIASCA